MTPPDADWWDVPADPDPVRDLGYRLDDWETLQTQVDDSVCFMFLPRDELLLRRDAFIVADPAAVCDVRDRR